MVAEVGRGEDDGVSVAGRGEGVGVRETLRKVWSEGGMWTASFFAWREAAGFGIWKETDRVLTSICQADEVILRLFSVRMRPACCWERTTSSGEGEWKSNTGAPKIRRVWKKYEATCRLQLKRWSRREPRRRAAVVSVSEQKPACLRVRRKNRRNYSE